MSARVSTWLGVAAVASLVILAATLNISRKQFTDEDDESFRERALAYARARLGGAAVASIAKGGDPDSVSSPGLRQARAAATAHLVSRPRNWPLAERGRPRRFGPIRSIGRNRISMGSRTAVITGRGRAAPGCRLGRRSRSSPACSASPARDQVTAGRTTALLVDRTCNQGHCRVWIGAAGGGVWRTDKGLHTNNPGWKFSSDGLGSNAFGSLAQDPNDEDGDTLYAGTGEPNASADSEAGVGLYKSTDGGESWQLDSRDRGDRGDALDRQDRHRPDRPPHHLHRHRSRCARDQLDIWWRGLDDRSAATEHGSLQNDQRRRDVDAHLGCAAAGSIRGVTDLEIDPNDRTTVYASAFQLGIYRSLSGGPFQQVFAGQAADDQRRSHRVRAGGPACRQDANLRDQRFAGRAVALLGAVPHRRCVPAGAGQRERCPLEEAHVQRERRSVLRDLRLLHRTVLVRPGRRDASWTTRHRLRDRFLYLRRGGIAVERARRAAFDDGRRTGSGEQQPHVHRHDVGRTVAPLRDSPRSARAGVPPDEPEHLVEHVGWRRRAVERRICRHLEPVRRPAIGRGEHSHVQSPPLGGPLQDVQPERGSEDTAVHECLGESAESNW